MNVVVPTVLIASVTLLMLAVTSTLALVHGWQDGPDNRGDRHRGIPALAYTLGWRLRAARQTLARRELEERRAIEDAKTAKFYADLNRAVRERARKERA